MKTISGLFVVSACFSTVASATIIGAGDLPNAIQSCITTLNCNVSTQSVFDQGGTSAFRFNEGGTDKWLMRYSLFAPSGENGTPATGYLWMSANQRYASAESYHKVTLYTDAVIPTPRNLWINSNAEVMTFGLNSADLVAGSGYLLKRLDEGSMYSSSGDLQTYDNGGYPGGLIPCISDGCQVRAQLNLTHLRYFALGSGQLVGFLKRDDSRSLLYSQSNDFNSMYPDNPSLYLTQEYFVQPVPLPASAWLFASSLLGLTRFVRRRQSKEST